MKNFKKLLFTANLLLISSIINAQYLVSATEIANRNAFQVQNILNDWGYNTSQMILNDVISYKITYNTIDVFGNPTIASGALFVPQVDCDTLPFVSNQHGTITHKAQVPSNNINPVFGLIYSGNGYITTMPDYLGMGENQGIHPYIHWESEATASIDLIRAAREFINESLGILDNNQLFLTGYSQGGHATMAVHKYITINNLQNEFNVEASSCGSGAFPLSDVQTPMMLSDSIYERAEFLPFTYASYQLVYGNLYDNYNEVYDPPYDSIIADWLVSGIHTNAEWMELIPDNYYDFMQDSVFDNILNNPNHPVYANLKQNDLHNWIPQEPVRMVYCGNDIWVFPENSIEAKDTMIALGANNVLAIDLDPTEDHWGCIPPAHTYSLEWFDSLKVECGMVITSVPSLKKEAEISLYPNPLKDFATFSSIEITYFELYDTMGVLIMSRNSNKVEMSNLNPGVYFVIGFDEDHHPLYKGKIIKK